MAKPMQENALRHTNILLKPADRHLCSRFVEDVSFRFFFQTSRPALLLDFLGVEIKINPAVRSCQSSEYSFITPCFFQSDQME
jgi:hypothetical protein